MICILHVFNITYEQGKKIHVCEFFSARDWRCASLNGQLVCGMGYGMQPTFVNCADFTILAQGAPVPAGFHWPDYNSVYATIHGGHTGSGTTQGESKTKLTLISRNKLIVFINMYVVCFIHFK